MAPNHSFQWKTARGEVVALSHVETSHLLNIFKVLWEYMAPQAYLFPGTNRYGFSAYYTTRYMMEAERAAWYELHTRLQSSGYFVQKDIKGTLSRLSSYKHGPHDVLGGNDTEEDYALSWIASNAVTLWVEFTDPQEFSTDVRWDAFQIYLERIALAD